MRRLINSDIASATILISFGAVLGKVSALQLLVMALVENVIYEVNEYIVFDVLHVSLSAFSVLAQYDVDTAINFDKQYKVNPV